MQAITQSLFAAAGLVLVASMASAQAYTVTAQSTDLSALAAPDSVPPGTEAFSYVSSSADPQNVNHSYGFSFTRIQSTFTPTQIAITGAAGGSHYIQVWNGSGSVNYSLTFALTEATPVTLSGFRRHGFFTAGSSSTMVGPGGAVALTENILGQDPATAYFDATYSFNGVLPAGSYTLSAAGNGSGWGTGFLSGSGSGEFGFTITIPAPGAALGAVAGLGLLGFRRRGK